MPETVTLFEHDDPTLLRQVFRAIRRNRRFQVVLQPATEDDRIGRIVVAKPLEAHGRKLLAGVLKHVDAWRLALSLDQRILLVSRHRGLLSEVAAACGVYPSAVQAVFHGRATSKRISAAIAAALEARKARIPMLPARAASAGIQPSQTLTAQP